MKSPKDLGRILPSKLIGTALSTVASIAPLITKTFKSIAPMDAGTGDNNFEKGSLGKVIICIIYISTPCVMYSGI